METSTQVLIILVSATLTVFLIVASIATIFAVQILRSLKRVTKKAESIANKADNIGSLLENAGGKLAIGRVLTNLIDTVRTTKNEKKEK